MTQVSTIEWTDMSSNPLRAYNLKTGKRGWFCVHASDGCRNCYAEKMNLWIGNGLAYTAPNAAHVRLEMDLPTLNKWARLKPGTRVFAFDMTDLFQEAVPDSMLDLAFAAMAVSPATFQILTKRAERRQRYLSDPATPKRIAAWAKGNLRQRADDAGAVLSLWPLPNVWEGVSCEDQRTADQRIPLLLQTPAAVRFVSYEPALGPVDFGRYYFTTLPGREAREYPFPMLEEQHRTKWVDLLDWIIVGGESGPGARPFDVEWARSAVRQCKAAGVPVFVKQLGAWPFVGTEAHWDGPNVRFREGSPHIGVTLKDRKGGDPAEWPEDLRVREFPA